MVDVVVQRYLDSKCQIEDNLLSELLNIPPLSSSRIEAHFKLHITLINRLYVKKYQDETDGWIRMCWNVNPPLILELFEITAKLSLFHYLMPLLTHRNMQIQSDILHVFSKFKPPLDDLPFPHPAVLQLLAMYPDRRYFEPLDLQSIPDASFYLLLPLAKKFNLVEKIRQELFSMMRMKPFFIFSVNDDENAAKILPKILSEEYGPPPFLFYVLLYEHTLESSNFDSVLMTPLFELVERRKYATRTLLMILKILQNVCFRIPAPQFPSGIFQLISETDFTDLVLELIAPFHFTALWAEFESNIDLVLPLISRYHQPLPEYVYEKIKCLIYEGSEEFTEYTLALALKLTSTRQSCVDALLNKSNVVKACALEEIFHRYRLDDELEKLLLTFANDFDHSDAQCLAIKILLKHFNCLSPSTILNLKSIALEDSEFKSRIIDEIKQLNPLPTEFLEFTKIEFNRQQYSFDDDLKRLFNELNADTEMDCY